ncbi:MAG: hypothetical protein KDD40_00950 [Bdellovibrionales bacterium]|nr:hypothetical protein [Bdellovibrionales bacterium]
MISRLTYYLLFCLFFSTSAWAYIPSFDYIVKRTSELHGYGIFLVDQDVTIIGANQKPLTVHEQWLIDGEKKLRMRVTGRNELSDQLAMTILYNDNRKYFVNSSGKVNTSKVSEDFFEPLFYFRNSAFLKSLLYNLNIIPRVALADPPHLKKVEDIKLKNERFVRLARSGGVVNYGIGEIINGDSGAKNPGLWIEQDFFHVRKFRSPTNIEITADKYQNHRNNFWLPQIREFRWNDNKAIITVTQVKSFGSSTHLQQRLKTSSLNASKEPELKALLPDNEQLLEFYRRFR